MKALFGSQFGDIVHHEDEDLELGTSGDGSQCRERRMQRFSLLSSHIQSRSPAPVTASLTLRGCLPSSVNPLEKLPHRPALRLVSQAILDLVKVTDDISALL